MKTTNRDRDFKNNIVILPSDLKYNLVLITSAQLQTLITVLKKMKTYSDDKRSKQSEKKKILKEKVEFLVILSLKQTSQLKEIDAKEINFINQTEELKFQLQFIYQEYIKQKALFKELLTTIKEKESSTNIKAFKDQLIRKIESSKDFREVLIIIFKQNDVHNNYNCEEIIKFPKLKSYQFIFNELCVKQDLFFELNNEDFVDDVCECKELKTNRI